MEEWSEVRVTAISEIAAATVYLDATAVYISFVMIDTMRCDEA
jgi:hypothetical protein